MRAPLFFPLTACLLLALPWLTPFAPGPSPAVVPWLVALVATAALLGLSALRDLANGPSQLTFAAHWAAPFAAALVLAGGLSAAMGLLQYFGLAGALEPWVKQGMPGEAFANLRQRNQFATLTNMALVALLWFAARPSAAPAAWPGDMPVSGIRWYHIVRTLGLIGAAALLAIGNAASSSRIGLLQLVGLVALFAAWGGWQFPAQRRVLLTAVLAYGVSLLVLPYLAGIEMGLFTRLRDTPYCASRLVLWSNVLHLTALKPWLGWGWGELDFAHYMTLYSGPRFCDILDNAHNLPLHLAFTWGVPVALAACGLLGWWVLARAPWRERDTSRQMAWGVLAVIALHSLVEYPLWYGPFQLAAGLCVGLLWRRQHAATSGILEPDRPLGHTVRAQAALILIATASYALWDYHRISQVYLPPVERSEAYRGDAAVQARKTRLFRDQVDFAELTVTPVTPQNVKTMFILADRMLHYSPEPRVIEKVIESAEMLGLKDDALVHLARFRAAFPVEYARWAQAHEQAVWPRSGGTASGLSSKERGLAEK
jgi:O-antigen ligase